MMGDQVKDVAITRTEEGDAILLVETNGGIGPVERFKITEEQLRYLFSKSGDTLANVNP